MNLFAKKEIRSKVWLVKISEVIKNAATFPALSLKGFDITCVDTNLRSGQHMIEVLCNKIVGVRIGLAKTFIQYKTMFYIT